MTTTMKPRPIPNEADLHTEVLRSAPLLQASLECSDALKAHAREMLAIITHPDTDHDDRFMAVATLADILFPNPATDGHVGMDLEESEALGAEHSPEVRDTLRTMDQEEAAFAERLREAMEKSNLTQVELAQKVGVGQPAISNMLQRQCRPQRRTVARLAEALGMAPAELWPGYRP